MGAAPGWYPHPSGGQRWWDGSRWLEPAAPTSSRWPAWAGVAAVAVFLAVVVVAVNVADSRSDEDAEPAPTTTRRAAPTVAGSPIPPSPGEAYKIGSGPWLSGIYEAPGGSNCSWVVQRDLVGDASSVIRRGTEPRVGLRDGEYFTSDGCGTWRRVGRI